MDQKRVKKSIKYSSTTSESLQVLLGKIAHQPTTHTRASQLRRLVHAFNDARKQIGAEYKKDIEAVYALRNEKGEIKRAEHEPEGFETDPNKTESFQKALSDFGNREVSIELERAIPPDALADIKLSASELELLGELVADENGPGVPNVTRASQM